MGKDDGCHIHPMFLGSRDGATGNTAHRIRIHEERRSEIDECILVCHVSHHTEMDESIIWSVTRSYSWVLYNAEVAMPVHPTGQQPGCMDS